MSPQVYRRRADDVIPVVDTGRPGAPNGYLQPGDLAICRDCASGADDASRAEWYPLGHLWGEVDSPTHCDLCEALIVQDLTPEGLAYVREQVEAADGRPNVLAAWALAFLGEAAPGEGFSISDEVREVLRRVRDEQYAERDRIWALGTDRNVEIARGRAVGAQAADSYATALDDVLAGRLWS